MTARLDTDPDLLGLVRSVDPMRDPQVEANAGLDTESALLLVATRLDRPFGPRRVPRRHRMVVRTAGLAGAVASLVFVLVNLTSTGHGSGVSAAQAKTILRHVRDALAWPPHAIYEEKDVTTVTARDGATFTSVDHEWLSTSPPYNMRLIQMWGGKVQWEQAFVNGRLDIYDPRTNTVYLAPRVVGNQVTDKPQWNSALSEVQYLLQQPNVRINQSPTLDNKPSIELTFDHGRFSYWISRSNYQPLQSEDRQDRLPDGQGGVGTERYPIARVLTGSAASSKLLSLQAQHPQARIDHSQTSYWAARRRMENVTRSVVAAIKH